MGIGDIWNLIIVEPMLNSLIVMSRIMLHNFGLAILAFTVAIRFILFPLTLRQLRTTKALSQLQPKLQELAKKYKDPARRQQEQMKLYKEHGVSPLGCLGPTLIQFPIWIGLYQSIIAALAVTPEGLLGISDKLYSWPLIYQAPPLGNHFLWLDLGRPDPFPIMAILVGASMWVQQKMMTVPSLDPKQQSMSNMMLWLMPIMFALWTLYFPSGLALYWVTSNIVGIVMQYLVSGWGSLTLPRLRPAPAPAHPTPPAAPPPTPSPEPEAGPPARPVITPAERRDKKGSYGKYRGKRQVRRGGRRGGPGPARPGPQPGPDRGAEQG